ncbi:lysophospholipid acyltransferase family protein [Tersicoccus sp. MR15.9]|uniref:lysophospholipid acyltransferase family protein n=1 Tax=Tersicoccus mangrovi TaxID=3121635 RepID=UPI002FE6ABD6
MNRWSRPVGRFLDHALYATDVVGADTVPSTGAVIFAANHISALDGPVLVGAAPRYMNVLVKQEMFTGFLGRVLQYSGQLPVNRAGDRRALQTAKAVLDEGRCVGILPEGTRGGGDVAAISGGVAWLALATGAPVVPVAVLGTRHTGERTGHIPRLRRRFTVDFGVPNYIIAQPGLTGRKRMEVATELIREALATHVAEAVASSGMALPGD